MPAKRHRRPPSAAPAGGEARRLRARTPWHWGLALPRDAGARRIDRLWRLPLMLALVGTIPAFYLELLHERTPPLATAAYALAAAAVALALAHVSWRSERPWRHLMRNSADVLLAAGLLASALAPPSQLGQPTLVLRLVVSLLTLVRMLWAMQGLITRGGLTYLLVLSLGVLGLCGAGFWWLEPDTPTFGDGLWLAFTTAATVGYGDVVPTTPASKIFAVFVVLLGFGVLTMVTAAIATSWIETEERQIEREILEDMRRQVDSLRTEIVALRHEARAEALRRAEAAERAPRAGRR